MYIKDIILKSCDFIGKSELGQNLENGSLTEEEQCEIDGLVKSFNLIVEEIASQYQPIMQTEKFIVKNFKLEFSTFSKPVCEIYSIKDKFGRNVNYKIFDGYIFVCGKEVDVIYSTYPQTLSLEDEIDFKLPERIFAYGVAREYFFANNLYEDANMWEERFKGALSIMLRRKSEVRMPRRRWI
ncbi:MAG: hypothetical protein J6K97_03780 [Clostridia bacterium]|nr:hypothetical protein [Clostridia bacterium]